MKRFLCTLLVLALLVTSLVGCNNKPTNSNTSLNHQSSTNDEKIMLKMLAWGGTEERTLLEEIISNFESENENIDIQLEIPASYWPKLQTMIAGNSAPDIFFMGFPEFKEYSAQGVLLDLDKYITNSNIFDKNDFYESHLNAYFNKETETFQGVPKDWSTYVFYYNKTLFENAGVKTPREYYEEGKWTMDNMLNVAKEIQEKSNVEYGVAVEPHRWKAFTGNSWVDPNTLKVKVNQEQFAKDLQFMANLWLVGKVAPGIEELNSLGASARFSEQNVAMFMSGRWMTMQFKNIKDFEWDIVPMPKSEARNENYTWMDSVALVISRTTKHPDEAWKFLEYYTSKEVQAKIARAGQALPARKSVLESQDFINGLKGINNAAHTEYEASTIPVFNDWGKVWNILNNHFTDIWNGNKTAEQVVKKAQDEINKLER